MEIGWPRRRRRWPASKMNSNFLLVANHVTLLAVTLLAAAAVATPEDGASSAAVNDLVRRPFSCPTDCQCKKAQTVDCRGIGVDNITGLLLPDHYVVKL